ncbi:MAG: DUF3102 domain-containing protein [Anaerolineae bacterium]|nr:DUF3102 domain-containing protein [Anaerolineae bacterium]
MEQMLLFDYQQLDSETRIVIQQRAGEIKTLMRRTTQDIIEIGQKLIEVKSRLPHGAFGGWLESEFSWTHETARRFMNVARQFPQIPTGLEFQAKALYLLAEPSTPEPARQEAIALAEAGERITDQTARAIVDGHKHPPANGFDASPAPEQSAPTGRQMKPKSSQVGDIYTAHGYDACQTPAYAADPILPYIKPGWKVWEPAVGEGLLKNALCEAGFPVVSSDILYGQNFFEYEPESWDCLITNPPYSIKYDWLKRCFSLGKPFALLLPVETIAAESGAVLFRKFGGLEVIFVTPRINFKMPNAGWSGNGAQFPTAWFTWKFGIGQSMTWVRR